MPAVTWNGRLRGGLTVSNFFHVVPVATITYETDVAPHLQRALMYRHLREQRWQVLHQHDYERYDAYDPYRDDAYDPYSWAKTAERYRSLATQARSGPVIPASPQFLDQWGITDPARREKVGPRLTDFPFRCATDAVQFDPAALDRVPKIYVNHTRPPLANLRGSLDRAVAAGWPVHELPYGHDLMLAAPGPTADLLTAIAAQLS